MLDYRTTSDTAVRIRSLTQRATPTSHALLLTLADEIEARSDEPLRIHFTRSKRRPTLDLETGCELLQMLEPRST